VRAWLLRWWQRLVMAGVQPLADEADVHAARLERMVMGLAEESANRAEVLDMEIRGLREQHARTAAAQAELLSRLADRIAGLKDDESRLAQLDARFTHLVVMLTGKSATEIAETLHTRPPRAFTFEHRQ